MNNIKRNKNYNQVCVWPGTILPETHIAKFVNHFKENGFRIQHLETLRTFPDHDDKGKLIEGTGGRSDVLFAIHDEDVMKFAIPRMQMGIRWIEDVLDNEPRVAEHSIYPERIKDYRTW
tara:strand:- start:882 stop:1238 length:357 start_codon:yes stop_codon:yes gene_type:complete